MNVASLLAGNSKRMTLHRIRRAGLAVLLAWGLAAPLATAQVPRQALEDCLELSTDQVSLSSSLAGPLVVKSCATCDSQHLTLDAKSQFFIGPEQVSYNQLRAAASQPKKPFFVYYKVGTQTVTRLRLYEHVDGDKK
jgi:hypothetical protein